MSTVEVVIEDGVWPIHKLPLSLDKKGAIINCSLIDGDVRIRGCPELVSLGSLEKIAGAIRIENCPNLEDLGSLSTVCTDLAVGGCPKLGNLRCLEMVGGNVILKSGQIPFDLGALSFVGGKLVLGTSVYTSSVVKIRVQRLMLLSEHVVPPPNIYVTEGSSRLAVKGHATCLAGRDYMAQVRGVYEESLFSLIAHEAQMPLLKASERLLKKLLSPVFSARKKGQVK